MSDLKWMIFLASIFLVCACSKPIEIPVAIEDVRMEAGLQTDQVIFFARFVNAKGKLVPVEGSLDVQLFQNDREFYKTTFKIEPKSFVPYGMGSNVQFQSETTSINVFSYQPKFNKVGWYDHVLKARFTGKQGSPVLTWNGGYAFKSIFDKEDKPTPVPEPKL